MSYIATLNPEQRHNLNSITSELKTSPITNILTQASVLSVSSKECEFKMAEEASYAHTPNERIREIFGSHFTGVSEDDLTALKQNSPAFFNRVYGGQYGNGPEEGYLYRSRGFNSETFKGNYIMVQDRINARLPAGKKIDLVYHPELLNTPDIAAKACIEYFIFKFNKITAQAIIDIHAKNINGFTNIEDALTGIYRANAGWGKPIFPDNTGGFKKAHDRVNEFLEFLKTS